jgi:hypothetical protein
MNLPGDQAADVGFLQFENYSKLVARIGGKEIRQVLRDALPQNQAVALGVCMLSKVSGGKNSDHARTCSGLAAWLALVLEKCLHSNRKSPGCRIAYKNVSERTMLTSKSGNKRKAKLNRCF